MSVETIRMSSKGQIVIPQDIREDMNASEGTIFAVIGSKDCIVLKKIEIPSKEKLFSNLDRIAEEATSRLKKKGISEKDFPTIVENRRKMKK